MRRRTKLGLAFSAIVVVLSIWRLGGGGAAQEPHRNRVREGREIADRRWEHEHDLRAAAPVHSVTTYTPPPAFVTAGIIMSPDDCARACGSECDEGGACPKVCSGDTDCPADRICDHTSTGLWRCLASSCRSDDDCGADGTCVYEPHQGRTVRRCEKNSGKKDQAVAVGAICRATTDCPKGTACADGMCLPATCATTADCPRGAICGDLSGREGARSCVGACTSDADCPKDMTCHDTGMTGAKCTRKFEADCLSKGCPAGLACTRLGGGADWVAECRQPCKGDGDTTCGEGGACTEINEIGGKKTFACMPACTVDTDCTNNRTCHWTPGLPMGTKVCLT